MELQGFPFLNQLTEFTTDGRPSEDAQFLCVPTSIAAGIMYLTGKHLSPDAMKDEVYGEGWVDMGTAASAFVAIADRNGVKMTSRTGDGVAIAHEELAKGHPVVFTQQDDYAPGHPDWTHVCVWYKDGPGWLSAMDPYGAHEVQFDDATWRGRLRSNEVWILEKKMGVPTGWKDDGTTLSAPNNVPVVRGFRNYVLNRPWDAANWPVEPERGANPLEMSNPSLGGGTRQRFRAITLEWTSSRGVFEAWTGPEMLALEQKVADLNQQLASTQNADKAQLIAQNQQLAAQVTSDANRFKAINAKAAPFEPKQ